VLRQFLKVESVDEVWMSDGKEMYQDVTKSMLPSLENALELAVYETYISGLRLT